MVKPYHRASKDGNHNLMRDTFVLLGCSVVETHLPPEPGFPDLLVGCAGVNHLVEVKDPGSAYGRRGMTVSQTRFTQRWSGEKPALVGTVTEVLDLVKKWRTFK
jgi:hypothetical protein